ncbi:MAG: acyltransferase [Sphingomonadales bacterium]|nr:acyltransferase [Sphingomonadales bacterium]
MDNASANSGSPRLDNIDAMRALAIISVLLFHYTSHWPAELLHADRMPHGFDYGWAGVDLFFMVSGYCIFMTLEHCRTLAAFWARRFARLQPAYMVAVVATFATVSVFGLPGNEVSPLVAAGDLLWFDIHPAWGYVDGAYWSLVAEVEFYFWFGLIYFLVRGRHVSLAWSAFAIAGSILLHAEDWGWRFGHSLTVAARSVFIAPFAPAFLVGLIAYEFRGRPTLGVIIASVVAIALLFASPRYASLPWLGIAIAGGAFLAFRMTWLRLPRAITFIGLISYSLYLVHQFIGMVIIRELAPAIPALWPRIIIATAAVILLATGMFYAIELRWQKRLARAIEPIIEWAIGWLPRAGRLLRKEGTASMASKVSGASPRVDAARRW